MIRQFVLGAAFALASTVPAFADDVTDQINEALKAYESGDLTIAEMALNTAAQIIRQKSGEKLGGLLPEALPGWAAEEAQIETGAAMFGGGTTATRVYTKDDQSIEISITANSPMLQSMAAMLTNPMFAGSSGKLLIIDGRKTVYSPDENSLQAVVDASNGPALVKVSGYGDIPESLLKEWFGAIDLDAVEAAL